MKRILVRLALWFLVKLGTELVEVISGKLREAAEERVRWAEERYSNLPGDYRRQKVYTQLVKEYPRESKRDIAMAIEQAVARML